MYLPAGVGSKIMDSNARTPSSAGVFAYHVDSMTTSNNALAEQSEPTITRCSSGSAGLDDVLGGGLPVGHFYLVEGEPGTGKTTLALQFVAEGIKLGEKVLYVTLSESRQELLTVADTHGLNVDGSAV